jgi:hypothetical protein
VLRVDDDNVDGYVTEGELGLRKILDNVQQLEDNGIDCLVSIFFFVE